MNLRPTAIAVVLAAAGGAAVARMAVPRPPAAAAIVLGTARPTSMEPDFQTGPNARNRLEGRQPDRGRQAVVYVAGEVVHPGVYRMSPTSRAVDAVQHAGGPTRLADLVAVNLAAPVQDGTELVVPAKGASSSTGVESGSAMESPRRSHRHPRASKRHRQKRAPADSYTSAVDVPPAVIDVNTADAASLETLPGIGPALAERIVRFRSVNGPFASGDELLDVAGMTQNKADALLPYVTFH